MLRRIFTLSNGALFVALALSTIAAWYSIIGLTAIFAGAVLPIIIMGTALEFAKITTTVWLRKYWYRCSLVMKMYLVPAVVLLALLTSMGIFGFLSKAHLDQNIGTGDVQAQVSLLDEKIATQRENIKSSKSMLAQMDQQVNDIMTKGDSERAVERSVAIRKQQAKERSSLQKDIETSNKEIQKLNEQRSPIASELRKVEAEVGPIKYIAALIYGDNADQNMLEAAVRWVIILLVSVFDPLAIMLVLAANQSRDWDENDDVEEENKLREKVEHGKIVETILEESPEAFQLSASDDCPSTEQIQHTIDVARGAEPRDIVILAVTEEEEEAFNALVPKEEKTAIVPDYQILEEVDDEIFTEVFVPSNKVEPKFDIDNMTVDSTVSVNEIAPVSNDIELPDDYPTITSVDDTVVVHTDTPNFEGFRDTSTGEWVQTGPAFHVEEKTENPSPGFRRLDNGEYVEFEGKRMHERVLKGLRPDLFAIEVDEPNIPKVGFGDTFTTNAGMGDVFTRIDTIPNRVFKYNGTKWIQVSRETTDTYLSNPDYIQYLIEKLSTGEYDPDHLTSIESDAISEYIKTPNKNA